MQDLEGDEDYLRSMEQDSTGKNQELVVYLLVAKAAFTKDISLLQKARSLAE